MQEKLIKNSTFAFRGGTLLTKGELVVYSSEGELEGGGGAYVNVTN